VVLVSLGFAYLAPKWHTVRERGWANSLTAAGPVVESARPETGLRAGDRILAFNGDKRVRQAGTAPYIRNYPTGVPYRLQVARGEETLEFVLTIREEAGWNVARGMALFWVGILCCAVSTWIGWKDPDSPMVRITWFAGMMAGLQEIRIGTLAGAAWPASAVEYALVLVGPWQPYIHYRFAAALPTAEPERGRWRILQRCLFALVAFLAVQSLPFDLAGLAVPGEAGIRLGQFAGWLRPYTLPVWIPAIALCGAAAVAVSVRNYQRAKSEDLRRRIRWVATSIMLSWGVFAVCGVLVGVGRLPASVFDWGSYLLALVPLTLGYAIVRHRVLGMRVVVRRGLQCALARSFLECALLAVPAILVVRGLLHPELSMREAVRPPQLWLGILAAISVLLLARNRLLTSLDRRFFREAWDQEAILSGLPEAIRRQISLRETIELVRARILDALHPEFVEVLCSLKRGAPVEFQTGEPAPADWRFPARLTSVGAIRDPRGEMSGWTPDEQRWIVENQVELMISIPARDGSAAGALLLGAKKSEEPYTGRDIALLSAVADHLGLAQENHLLAVDRADAVLEERTRMARELHDTLAQGFAGISLHLESARMALPGQPATAGNHLEQARQLARASLAEARRSVYALREPVRQAAALRQQLLEMAHQLTAGTSVEVRVETSGDTMLPDLVGENLFRIAQEGVTNALKHSGADRIEVMVEFDPTRVQLFVRDNGRGFDSGRPSAGYGLTGMRERVAQMRGELAVRGAAGGGTEVCASVQYA
jgi:signal transduction histidine kinase